MTNLNKKMISPKAEVIKAKLPIQQSCDFQTNNSTHGIESPMRQKTGPIKGDFINSLGTKSKSSVRRSKAFKRRISADATDDYLLGGFVNEDQNALASIVNIEIDPKKQ